MRNFDFLKNIDELGDLHYYCSNAEDLQLSKPKISVMNARMGLEWLVHAIYKLKGIKVETKDSLFELTQAGTPYAEFIDDDMLMKATSYVRATGNKGHHIGSEVSKKESFFTVLNLYNQVATTMMKLKVVGNLPPFNKQLIHGYEPNGQAPLVVSDFSPAYTNNQVVVPNVPAEFINKVDKEAVEHPSASVQLDLGYSEAETRKLFIDMLLEEAGWKVLADKGAILPSKACIEVELEGMPNSQNTGYADYVLFGADGKPLAVVEAKKTMVEAAKGRHQAELYAGCLEKKYGVRPVIYYTNGFKTYIIDGLGYPPREILGFHTENDLNLLIQRRGRGQIADLNINEDITNREYQKRAIKSVCEHFNTMHRRGLLVMATGTGKTRVSISLCDVLMRNGWVKNVLFLADRTALVRQAKKNFVKLMPNASVSVISDEKDPSTTARIVFSTYQTMINYIDREDKPFSVGRFDLVIIDEAHRSVFGKYTAILSYFDALMVGLTATPRQEVDRSTYDLFQVEAGSPNFAYELEEAVADGYLVNYSVWNRTTDIMKSGIEYDKLSDDEKKQLESIWKYEKAMGTLVGDNRDISKTEIFKYIYNDDTCDKVLQDLMENGIKINSGDTIGKTIVFACDHTHAQQIVKRFAFLYPSYGDDFCQLIDNYVTYAQDLVEQFGVRGKMPQIAVSVDMLDTGVDVPDIVNLVFFKPVHSKIKFWQMVGRGTRLSEGLFDDGTDKKGFYIFDWCGNFDYFGGGSGRDDGGVVLSLTERLFQTRCDLVLGLQHAKWQSDAVAKQLHDDLKKEMREQVDVLNNALIAVRNKWALVEKYRKAEAWVCLTSVDANDLKEQISPLLVRSRDADGGRMFDYFINSIELSVVNPEKVADKFKSKVTAIAELLLEKASIPEVAAKLPLLNKVALPTYWADLSMAKLEHTRTEMRDLMKYLKREGKRKFVVDIEDLVQYGATVEGTAPQLTYKQRVIEFLARNKDLYVLKKIQNMQRLDFADVQELERICWEELGTKEEYRQHVSNMACGDSVAAFIRSQIGVDRTIAVQRFSNFIQGADLNSAQEEFIKSIVTYVCENGDIKVETLIEEDPFKEYDLIDIFGQKTKGVRDYVIDIHDLIAG